MTGMGMSKHAHINISLTHSVFSWQPATHGFRLHFSHVSCFMFGFRGTCEHRKDFQTHSSSEVQSSWSLLWCWLDRWKELKRCVRCVFTVLPSSCKKEVENYELWRNVDISKKTSNFSHDQSFPGNLPTFLRKITLKFSVIILSYNSLLWHILSYNSL